MLLSRLAIITAVIALLEHLYSTDEDVFSWILDLVDLGVLGVLVWVGMWTRPKGLGEVYLILMVNNALHLAHTRGHIRVL